MRETTLGVSVIAFDHSATRRVYAYIMDGAGIARLFAEAAREWRGWNGSKTWESLEGELRIERSVDTLGHVLVAVRVRSDQDISDRWQLHAELTLDSGQLDDVARGADRLWRRGG